MRERERHTHTHSVATGSYRDIAGGQIANCAVCVLYVYFSEELQYFFGQAAIGFGE
jgi:hypothetical protein